jgi:hypothetical protein
MNGVPVLTFADGEGVADLATYVARARSLDEDGAMRLQAVGRVLAGWVCLVPGQGLMRSGLVLGLRTTALAEDHRLDVTVPLAALADRFARRASTGDAAASFRVPPMEVVPQWAGVSPPMGGWVQVGEVATSTLLAAAEEGIAEVAQGAPTGSGAAAVAMLRARVWAKEVAGGAPAGAGLAARALGFARAGDDAVAAVHRSGVWTRVTLPSGHVLSR